MDVKELNKSQLILLAILLSFIVSIATGITTVSLMEQAPASFTVPVNKVIKETVERIVPVDNPSKNQTVIIKEEDLVVEAIKANKSSLFSITKEVQNESGTLVEVSAGSGFVVSKDGTIVSDALMVPSVMNYFVKNNSGKFKAEFVSKNEAGFSFLKIGTAIEPVDSKVSFEVPTFGDFEKMQIGQKIIILGNSITSIIFEGG